MQCPLGPEQMLPRPLTPNTFVTVGRPLCRLFPSLFIPQRPRSAICRCGVTLSSDTKPAPLRAGNASAVEYVT